MTRLPPSSTEEHPFARVSLCYIHIVSEGKSDRSLWILREGAEWLIVQIEEGEVDTERSRAYSICFRKQYKKEQDARREQERMEKQEARTKKSQNL